MVSAQPKGHLDLLLLRTLSHGSAHGYAVIADLRERSGGTFDLPEGTVYPALHRLEELGLVSSRWAQVEGRRRRVYELSGAGADALIARTEEWRGFAAGINSILGVTA
jgi:DNA-binding PadR family transcriptional regulator